MMEGGGGYGGEDEIFEFRVGVSSGSRVSIVPQKPEITKETE